MPQPEFRITFLHRFAGYVGAGLLHVIGRTSVVQAIAHPAALGLRRRRDPLIYAFWHNSQAFLAWFHRGQPVNVIVSQSKDGEYIAQVMSHLRLKPVRGSSSRGGENALRQVCAFLEAGQQAGFTPDGPRGPVQRIHGGVISAAKLTGAPIVPLALGARRKIVFRSWDRFFIPYPFNHITVVHGRPMNVGRDEDPIAAAERLRRAMNEAVELADNAVREAPSFASSVAGWLLSMVYSVLAVAAGPLSLLAFILRHGARRTFANFGERLIPGGIRETGGRRLWLHAASVGEWQALRPVLAELEKSADISLIVTVSSPEARALVSRDEPNIAVRMLPLDLPHVVSRWIRRARPDAAVIVETELWPNLIIGLRRAMVPVFIINGRLSARSARHWRLLRPFSRRLMSSITYFLVRTDLDGQRFCSIGAPVSRVTVTGNTKMDNLSVLTRGERIERRTKLFGPTPAADIILVAGSTWAGEEKALVDIVAARGERRLRLVIAPRRANRFEEVARLLEGVPFTWSFWSKAKAAGRWDTDILLVDTLGDLKNLYAAGDIAFVGGSLFPHGGQNPLEPASAGIPVLFGPHMENFHEDADDLKRAGGARQVRNAEDLAVDVNELAGDSSARATAGDAAARFVRSRQGAALQTAEFLRSALLLENPRG